MDYRDYLSGKTDDMFYFKAKNKLIDIIMHKACRHNKKRLKILNLGVGMGNDLKILNKYGDNYIIDIDPKVLNFIDKNSYFEKKVQDACNLPYPDNFFDIVVGFGILEHVKDDKKLVTEAYRTLKGDGIFIFSGPAYQFLFSSHDVALEHYRRYSKKRIKWLMKDFKQLYLYYWNFCLFLPIAIMRILKKFSTPKVDSMKFPKILDKILYKILNLEISFIKNNISLPFGIGFIGYCKKPTNSCFE